MLRVFVVHDKRTIFIQLYIRLDLFTVCSKMDDDDGPPMLVDSNGVDNEDADLNAETEDVKPTKVPISIITG